MKTKFLLFSFLCASFFLLSNKGGRNQPTTGAPFEASAPACANCHSGGNYTPVINVVLKDANNNVVSSFVPNTTYTVEMKISSTTGNPSYYGFQSVVVDKDNKNAGEFVTLGDKVRKLVLTNRAYLTQISPKADGIYTATWKAPELDSVRMYIAGLAANNNSGTGGDKGAFTSVKFAKSTTSNVSNPSLETKTLLISNTIASEIIFTHDVNFISLYDFNGRQVVKNSSDKNISTLATGIYILQYEFAGKKYSNKIFKM